MKPLFLIFPLLALLAHFYVAWRLFHLIPLPDAGKWTVAIATFLLLALAISSVMGAWDKCPMWVGSAAYDLGNTWLIMFLYLLIAFLALDVAKVTHLISPSLLADSWATVTVVAVALTALLVYGNVKYNNKVEQPLEVTTTKTAVNGDKRIVMISDLHAGYHNRRAEVARWIDIINNARPDFILIAGDIIDGLISPLDRENVAREFRRLNAPVYACLGNHEYLTGIDKSVRFYREAGITLLRDSVAEIDGITIIGRDDRSNPARKPLNVLTAGVDKTNYTILIDHQPADLTEAEDCRIDFQFSGHTHHGQVWPLNHVTDMIFEDAFGPYQRGETRYYVSSGLGIWGGKYRIATRSEYVVLTLKPNAVGDMSR